MWDKLWIDGRLATMKEDAPYGAIEKGALGIQDGRIVYAGRQEDLPESADNLAREVERLEGRWMTPGLIDCHTHLVYGGDRAEEFELRLEGASYAEIAKAGGGIVSTVKATRAANEEALYRAALPRIQALMAEGVTTVEIKSGYGLDLENELKMLRVARWLGESLPVTVKTTFLGAHAVPPEFDGDKEAYLQSVLEMLPEVMESGLADAVDGFCEGIAFSNEQIRRLFEKARELGLPIKLHADQLSDLGGAELIAEFGGLSADHLEYTSDAGIEAMGKAGAVAVILPGAFYTLRETQLPPIEKMRACEVSMALASDCNPGSAPVTSLLLMLNMACTLFRMTPEEALAGVTRNGARALGLAETHGTLEAGKAADLAIWDIERPAELSYRIGFNPLYQRIIGGEARSAQPT